MSCVVPLCTVLCFFASPSSLLQSLFPPSAISLFSLFSHFPLLSSLLPLLSSLPFLLSPSSPHPCAPLCFSFCFALRCTPQNAHVIVACSCVFPCCLPIHALLPPAPLCCHPLPSACNAAAVSNSTCPQEALCLLSCFRQPVLPLLSGNPPLH